MEQTPQDALGDKQPQRPQQPNVSAVAAATAASSLSVRPAPERNDSFLPPHLRSTITDVPVTPDITQDTYNPGTSDPENGPEGYFSRRATDHAIAASPAPDATRQRGQSFESKIAVGAQEGKEWLKRLGLAAMGRRESMSDIRAISPDLALSGNIISATFNIPHSLKYRKGADWVCCFGSCA